MRLLFVHNDKVKEDNNGNLYTGGCYNEQIWNRYLSLSNEFSVILRKDSKQYSVDFARKNFNSFNKELINYIEIPNLFSSVTSYFNQNRRKQIDRIVEEAVISNDLIIIRSGASYNCTRAIKYARRYNKPYLIEVTGSAWHAQWFHSLKGKVLAPFSEMKTKNSVKHASHAIYVTNEFLQSKYPNTGVTVGCSDVELKEYTPQLLNKRLEKIHEKTKEASSTVVLGTLAAVDTKTKGHKYVIQAISRLNKQGYNFEYQIPGSGNNSYLSGIAKDYGVEDKVKFLGSLPHEKVFDWLDSIDVYIQPSLTEGLPRAVVEAMSRACPVIGSNAGGIPELLNPNHVFKKGSVKEICNQLKQIKPNMMKIEAERSLKKAGEFDKNNLNTLRQEFYNSYVKYCKEVYNQRKSQSRSDGELK
ncbi:glycosyltransferase [Rossellomorea vietnamensis]|uniref:Glycosyltransferase n=1 Tax=Rossellomorea vietnamensis TaxID=218284 RepID=A0A5D4M234_9BACI|nr:glycosyltransferase [Rossellomorea vietnamensis]TYR95909.1 glycosyltransferase [Rossellomorea vietnamensis]